MPCFEIRFRWVRAEHDHLTFTDELGVMDDRRVLLVSNHEVSFEAECVAQEVDGCWRI